MNADNLRTNWSLLRMSLSMILILSKLFMALRLNSLKYFGIMRTAVFILIMVSTHVLTPMRNDILQIVVNSSTHIPQHALVETEQFVKLCSAVFMTRLGEFPIAT